MVGPRMRGEETGQQAHEDARDQRHHHRGQADQQRQARTVDQSREQVAAQFVGAQQVLDLAAGKP